MIYLHHYPSPLGDILLTSDDTALTGLWFDRQDKCPPPEYPEENTSAIAAAMRWLDVYFAGRALDFSVPLHPVGTDFQMEIWEMLRTIPYGRTTTYGEIADRITRRRGITKMSA